MEKVKKSFKMKLYKRGQTVMYKGNAHIVEDVFINRWDILLKLSFVYDRIRAEDVESEDTVIEYMGYE